MANNYQTVYVVVRVDSWDRPGFQEPHTKVNTLGIFSSEEKAMSRVSERNYPCGSKYYHIEILKIDFDGLWPTQ
jgi:hypothetical protein